MKVCRKLMMLAAVVLLIVAMLLPASAAKPEINDYGMLAIASTEEDLQCYMAVCIAEEDGNYVYSGNHAIQQQVSMYVSMTASLDFNTSYSIQEDIGYEDIRGVYRFALQEKIETGSTADVFPKAAKVKKNDVVYFVHLDTNGTEAFPTEKTTVTSIKNGVLTTKDKVEKEAGNNDFYVIFNDNREVVGFAKGGAAMALLGGTGWGAYEYGIIAGVVLGVLIVVVIIVKKNKKNRNKAVNVNTSFQSDSTAVDDDRTTLESETILGDMEYPMNNNLMLKCHGGYLNGRTYPIPAEGLTIGREPDNSIRYPGQTPGISRHHVRIFWQDGQLMLLDVGSSNGTYINQTGRIDSMRPVPLHPGDMFFLGEKLNGFEIAIR